MMSEFRLDRNVVAKKSFEQADDHVTFYLDKTPHERLEYACSIINQIFSEEQRKVKRHITSARKHAKSI